MMKDGDSLGKVEEEGGGVERQVTHTLSCGRGTESDRTDN